jgi:hypothetical protein
MSEYVQKSPLIIRLIKISRNLILQLLLVLYTTALGRYDCFQYTVTCPAHSPVHGTNNTTPVFHFKVNTSQDVRICVNIRTALSTVPATWGAKAFCYPFITFHLAFISFNLQCHTDYT